ncbi:MAG TPA: sensor domain-containing diguanylate cyclase, partial [Longimicrobiaceae bacterium]|nr:sensor domain-containing diguanylate cyclase [Longimicrobiaceae bacterium]
VHLALLASGGAASPLLPLAAAWIVYLGRTDRRAGPAGAAAAAVLVLLGTVLWGTLPGMADAVRVVLLFGLAAVVPLLGSAGRAAEPAAAPHTGDDEPAAAEDHDPDVLSRELELVRLATDAHEAALWRMWPDGTRASLLGWSALPGYAPQAEEVSLLGHPFGWAILEGVHVRLEHGRKPLPTPWAAEMLLVPVDTPSGLLALSYTGSVPPGAEPNALLASTQLGAIAGLIRTRDEAGRTEARVRTLFDAVRNLPGELDLDRFAEELAEAVRRSVDAAGAAVAVWDAEAGRGEILRVVGDVPARVGPGHAFADGESRLGLAAKHAVALSYEDLRRERDALPLCVPGERWTEAPRSAAVVPLAADGRVVGVVAAWDPRPERIGETEMEFLRLLGALAPLPLRSARQYEALDRRASEDALTGLPNRRSFEARLAAASSHFERYERPFSLLILDVDHFKRFNDTWGHEAGDRVLQHVAELVRASVREVDHPARLGGEEFVVLLPETPLMAAVEVAERVRKAIAGRPVVWHGRPLPVTASLGVAACPESVGLPGELLAAADAALYRSKDTGRNRTTAAPPGGGSVGLGKGGSAAGAPLA